MPYLDKILSLHSHLSHVGTEPLADLLGVGYSLQSTPVSFHKGQGDNATACANITLSMGGATIHREEFGVYLNTSDPNIRLIHPFFATVVVTDQDSEIMINYVNVYYGPA